MAGTSGAGAALFAAADAVYWVDYLLELAVTVLLDCVFLGTAFDVPVLLPLDVWVRSKFMAGGVTAFERFS